MTNLDATISVPLHIVNTESKTTLVQVEVIHLNRRVEVEVPNNIQAGHRIRLKGLGYGSNPSGDLIIEISKITVGNAQSKNVKQRMVVVENNRFHAVDEYLENGWRIVDYKPFRDTVTLYVYVLLEKDI